MTSRRLKFCGQLGARLQRRVDARVRARARAMSAQFAKVGARRPLVMRILFPLFSLQRRQNSKGKRRNEKIQNYHLKGVRLFGKLRRQNICAFAFLLFAAAAKRRPKPIALITGRKGGSGDISTIL